MTLQMIMAHAEAQETFDRHLPIWESLGTEIRVICPEDSWVKCRHPVIGYGKKAHSGSDAMERFFHMLRWLEGAETFDTFLIHEYDSFSLEMPPFTGFGANWFLSPQAGWISKKYAHPPLAITRKVLSETIAQVGLIPFHAERGMWDRVIGLVVPKNETHPFINGYSRNTIEPHHYDELRKAVAEGAKHYHGVKHKEVLDMILG